MPGVVVNRQDIVDTLKYVPASVFDMVLLQILKMKMDIFKNVKDVNTIQEQAKGYLGVRINTDGVMEVKEELDKEAKEHTQELVDIFNNQL